LIYLKKDARSRPLPKGNFRVAERPVEAARGLRPEGVRW